MGFNSGFKGLNIEEYFSSCEQVALSAGHSLLFWLPVIVKWFSRLVAGLLSGEPGSMTRRSFCDLLCTKWQWGMFPPSTCAQSVSTCAQPVSTCAQPVSTFPPIRHLPRFYLHGAAEIRRWTDCHLTADGLGRSVAVQLLSLAAAHRSKQTNRHKAA